VLAGKGAAYELSHAVQVVGYDNSKQAWLVKNSWGDGWASEGYGWVSFSAPGMCDPESTYGLAFTPKQPPAASKPQLTVVPGRPGCYSYKAAPGDYPEALATRFGLKLQQLLLDNLAVLWDPSRVPPGAALVLCGVSPAALAGAVVTGGVGSRTTVLPGPATNVKVNPAMVAVNSTRAPILSPAPRPVVQPPSAMPRVRPAVVMPRSGPAGVLPSSTPPDEMAALLAIKHVLDPSGTTLIDWQPGRVTACDWMGVICDDRRQRVMGIGLVGGRYGASRIDLTGRLPGGAQLRRLPALLSVSIGNTTRLAGSLPPDWSQLTQLESIVLSDNSLTGELLAAACNST
jgi:hypothetical protein